MVQASDHKFSKYDGIMEAVVIFTRLFSVLFLGLSPESFITLCSFSLSSTLAANPAMPTSLAEISGGEKKWNALWSQLRFEKFLFCPIVPCLFYMIKLSNSSYSNFHFLVLIP